MKRILLILLALALVSTAVVQADNRPNPPNPPTWYAVEQETASGGGYHLTSLAWQVDGAACSGGYRLLGPAAPALRGNGCCCTYLPCVTHRFP